MPPPLRASKPALRRRAGIRITAVHRGAELDVNRLRACDSARDTDILIFFLEFLNVLLFFWYELCFFLLAIFTPAS